MHKTASVCVQCQHVQWGAAEAGRQPQHQWGKLGRRAEGGGSTGAAGPRAAGPDSAQEEGGQNLQQDCCQALHQRQEVDMLHSFSLTLSSAGCAPTRPWWLSLAVQVVICHLLMLLIHFSIFGARHSLLCCVWVFPEMICQSKQCRL